jgi:gephyrin
MSSYVMSQDGYAVVSSDGPGEYVVVGESCAGHMDDIQLTPGHVAYITTGEQLFNSIQLHTWLLNAQLTANAALHSRY